MPGPPGLRPGAETLRLKSFSLPDLTLALNVQERWNPTFDKLMSSSVRSKLLKGFELFKMDQGRSSFSREMKQEIYILVINLKE